MNIMRVRLEDGSWTDIPVLRGAPGTDGTDFLYTSAFLPTAGISTIDKNTIEIPENHTLTERDILFNTAGVFSQVTLVDGDNVTVNFLFEITAGTPTKGVDYWTEEDQANIVADVLAALPVAEEVGY